MQILVGCTSLLGQLIHSHVILQDRQGHLGVDLELWLVLLPVPFHLSTPHPEAQSLTPRCPTLESHFRLMGRVHPLSPSSVRKEEHRRGAFGWQGGSKVGRSTASPVWVTAQVPMPPKLTGSGVKCRQFSQHTRRVWCRGFGACTLATGATFERFWTSASSDVTNA